MVPREVSADAGWSTSSMLWAKTRHGRVVTRAPRSQPSVSQGPDVTDQAGSQRYALRICGIRPDQAGQGIPAVPAAGTGEGERRMVADLHGHNLLKLFRFGVNLHRKARAAGPAQRIRNFAEVVSTALFAKLSGGPLEQPAVVAIHWRRPASTVR